MAEIQFTVFGDVMGKPRPRVNRNGHVWTKKKFIDCEEKIADAYLAAGGSVLSGEICITVSICRKLPNSRPKRLISEPDTYKPDIDNIAKIVLDALNGVAYEDDKQITQLHVIKQPRTRTEEHLTITVEELTR